MNEFLVVILILSVAKTICMACAAHWYQKYKNEREAVKGLIFRLEQAEKEADLLVEMNQELEGYLKIAEANGSLFQSLGRKVSSYRLN